MLIAMSKVVAMAALLLGLIAQQTQGREASAPGEILVVDFDASVRTEQGHFFDIVGGRPDVVRDRLATFGDPPRSAWRGDILRDAGDREISLVIPADSTATGPIEASGKTTLTLGIIGDLGDRRLSVEVAAKPDSTSADSPALIGMIAADQLDASRWQVIRLPVPEGLSSSSSAIRLVLKGPGPAWLAIDAIAFDSNESGSRATERISPEPHELRQCLWVWNTDRILGSSDETDALLNFAKVQGFTDLFVQVIYKYRDGAIALGMADRQRAFNARAAKLGVRVHALDGHPQYVLRPNHARMVALVEALSAFNRQAAPAERYHGVHLDNEPYVLPEWQSPDTRQDLIDSYIGLNRQLSVAARHGKLEYGVDIPFWWDRTTAAGAPEFRLTGDGGKPLLDALFALVDNVGVMSYRPRVTGSNGIIACCETEFDLGRRTGVDVFASVETGGGSDVEDGTSFAPYPREHFMQQLESLRRIAARTPGAAGISIHYYDALRAKLEDAE